MKYVLFVLLLLCAAPAVAEDIYIEMSFGYTDRAGNKQPYRAIYASNDADDSWETRKKYTRAASRDMILFLQTNASGIGPEPRVLVPVIPAPPPAVMPSCCSDWCRPGRCRCGGRPGTCRCGHTTRAPYYGYYP